MTSSNPIQKSGLGNDELKFAESDWTDHHFRIVFDVTRAKVDLKAVDIPVDQETSSAILSLVYFRKKSATFLRIMVKTLSPENPRESVESPDSWNECRQEQLSVTDRPC
jgi:hypothetical protein